MIFTDVTSERIPFSNSIKKELSNMFLTTALKDYIDQLNDLSLSLNDNFTLFAVFKYSLFYILDSIKLFFVYILSFQWLTDFVELPCNFKANYSAIFDGKSVLTTMLETKIGPNFFSFTKGPLLLTKNNFTTGLLNSFFLALPLSVPHLLTVRAFLLNGIPAAIYAAAGTILGQFLFLSCVLFGFEWVLIPFFSFEPVNYIIGLIVTVNLLYTMTHKPMLYSLNQTQKDILLPLFGVNFLLAWTEQTSIFQYFGNLTFNSFPTLLQNNFTSIIPNFLYLSGILIGTVAWTILFGAIIMGIRNWVATIFAIPFTFLAEKIHYGTLFITFVFCLTSIPYYGFDYLMSNPLGFFSQDKSLTWSKIKPVTTLTQIGRPEMIIQSMGVNVAPFDRPSLLKNDSDDMPFYEDLTFQPLQYWKNRRAIRSTIVMPIDQVKKMKANQNDTGSAENDKKALLSTFYKLDSLDTTQPNWSETLTNRDLEENVEALGAVVFEDTALAHSYFERSIDPIMFEQFRQKYYSNFLYKALTQFEINSFLLGQPNYQNLTAFDENELYKRRVIFERYLDSVEQYKSILHPENKAFAEKVYNQQFKGTFDLVRKFFSVVVSDPKSLSLNDQDQPTLVDKTILAATSKNSDPTVLKYDQPLYNEVIRDFNPLFHEELVNQFPNQRSKKLAVVDSTPFYIGWDGGLRKYLVKTNCLPGIPNGTSIAPSKSKFDAESPVSPLNNSTYLSFQFWPKTHGGLSVDSNLSLPYTQVSKEKSSELAEFLTLIDPKATVTSKEGSVNRVFKDKNLPSYNWSTVKSDAGLLKELATVIDLGTSIPPDFSGLTWPGVNAQKLFDKLNYLKNFQMKS